METQTTNFELYYHNWRDWIGDKNKKKTKKQKTEEYYDTKYFYAKKMIGKTVFCITNGGYFGDVIAAPDWDILTMQLFNKFGVPTIQKNVSIWDIRYDEEW